MQTRMDSFFEAVTNTFIGWFISMLTWMVVAWAMAIPVSFGDSLLITWIFTAVSIARSYLLRRLFNGKSVWQAVKERVYVGNS